MYRQCISEKTARQQREFERNMLEMLQNTPYDNISISDLCRRTGLSRKIFYRLYDGKSDVIYAMIDHAILDAQSYIPDESVGTGGVHSFLAYWREQKPLLDVLRSNQISALLQQQAVIHILEEDPEVIHSFGAEDISRRRDMIVFYISGLFSLVLDWHDRGFDRTIDELSAIIMDLLMNPPVKATMTER